MSKLLESMKRRRWVASREIGSENRKALRNGIVEGVPAIILANLLGGPLQTVYLTYLGFSAFHIGLVLAIGPFALLIQIVIAFIMQKYQNRKRMLFIAAVSHRILWVATGLIPLLFPQPLWVPMYLSLFLTSMIAGQASGVIWTSLMADVVPASLRGKYFGIRNTVHWGFVCATLLLGGMLMDWLPGAKGFTILYIISACCVVWNGWVLTRFPNPPFQPSESGASMRMLFRPLQDKTFLAATLFISVFILVQNIVIPLFSYIMLEVIQFSATKVTTIIMIQNLVMMASYYVWGVLNGRYSTSRLLIWVFPIIAISCILWSGMAIMPALLILLVAHGLLGIGLAGYNLLMFNYLIGDTPKSERPMYIGVFSALTGISGFIGPIVGGGLYDQLSDSPYWLQSYGIVVFAGCVLLALAGGWAPFIFRRRGG